MLIIAKNKFYLRANMLFCQVKKHFGYIYIIAKTGTAYLKRLFFERILLIKALILSQNKLFYFFFKKRKKYVGL